MKSLSALVLLALLAALWLPLPATAQVDAPPPLLPGDPIPTPLTEAGLAPDVSDAPAATFTVNSTADPGSGNCDAAECTLREAIIAANANGASKDTINFNIPGGGPHVIALAAALQAISQPVIVNGLSEADATCGAWPYTLQVVVNGSGLGGGAVGLKITASNAEIKGLIIHRFPSHGVEINGSNNQLSCNYIGVNSGGNAANFGNGGIGVFINNGGANALTANLIAGNGSYGIYVGGASANGNTINGNRIGVNATGTAALANGEDGILVQDAANTGIGATTGNVVSGNAGHGIMVSGNSPGTVIAGNLVGTNPAGASAIPNGAAGVEVNAAGVTLGGTTAASRNVISGNISSGVVLDKPGALLRRNLIGVTAGANAKLGNGSYGVYVRTHSSQIGAPGNGNTIGGNGQDGVFVESGDNNQIVGNYIGTNSGLAANLGNGMFGVHIYFGQNTLVGGSTSNAGNAIAFNAADGVYVPNAASQGNRLQANAIYSNGDLGIDLGDSGVTANDAGDGDSGPNGLQNFPVLTGVGSNGAATRFVGTLNSKANQSYRIEFFIAGGCDPSGYGEGRGFLGATTVITNGSGNAALDVVMPVGVGVGAAVSATATDASGNTSEFSQCRQAAFEKVQARVFLPLLRK